MEPIQTGDTHKAFKHIWKFWQVGGAFPSEQFKSAHLFYSIFINITVTIPLSVLVMISSLVEEDLRVAFTNVPFFLSFLALLLYKGHFYNIKEILKELDRRAIHEDETFCLKDDVMLCHLLFRIYGLMYSLAITVTIMAPLLSMRRFIFPACFPFDVTVESNYRIAFAYQIIAIFIAGTQSLPVDIFPLSYICVLCAQIKALGIRIRRIGREEKKKDSEENYKELINCVEDHKTILELFGEINITISRTISFQFMVTALVFGTLMMNMFVLKLNLMEMVALFIFLLSVTFQTLPVCYCADTLQIFNETLTGSIFNCNWIDENMKFRKSIIIFMQRTQQDLEILAWNVVPISLTTFLRIIKISFSKFAVLVQLKK